MCQCCRASSGRSTLRDKQGRFQIGPSLVHEYDNFPMVADILFYSRFVSCLFSLVLAPSISGNCPDWEEYHHVTNADIAPFHFRF